MENYKKQKFVELTKKEFQRYADSSITDEQAKEIQKNLFGFVELLLEWNYKEQCNNET